MLTIEQMRRRAYDLMAETIDLLDCSGCSRSAIHLAAAIDMMPPPTDGTVRADRAALNRSALDRLLDGQTGE